MALILEGTLKNDYFIGAALGLISAIIDNVPLVAATQGMYSLQTFPVDHFFWHFIAMTTGTGGSCIIIGSAAGVAVMGIEKIPFMWYLKNISGLALLGFAGGIATFVLMHLT
jgi:Na+/H+ antiporter NhaD/arsenite permease-like protein